MWQVCLLLSLSFVIETPLGWAQSVLPDGTVRFETGSSRLTAESERVLDQLSKLLARRPDLDPIELVGHADDRGTESVNQVLSLERAEVVRTALVRRGVRKSRVLVRGAGSHQPLSKEDTEAARRLNRRVEVWVTPPKKVAEVTKIFRKVSSKEAAAPKWKNAQMNMGLRRLAMVRTDARSASEVTFEAKDRVSMGPESLVVIYDAPRQTRDTKRRTADIEIQQGTLFAALAKRDLTVDAQASRVTVRSKKTRIDVRTAKKRIRNKPARKNAVSVYDGASDVLAVGKTVTVEKGYGTEVVEGEPPQEPRRLPEPPSWTGAGPMVTYEGRPLPLAWTLRKAGSWAEVQIGDVDDTKVDRPLALWRVKGTTTGTKSLERGAYFVRLAGVDGDLVGEAGLARSLVVLPAPRADSGKVEFEDDVIRLPAPGILEQPVPPGARLTLGGQTSSTAVRLPMFVAGSHELDANVETKGAQTRSRIRVEVQPADLSVVAQPARLQDGRSQTKVLLTVKSMKGVGLDGFQWVAGVVPQMTTRLRVGADGKGAWVDCRCQAPPSISSLIAAGDGMYTLTYETEAVSTPKTVILRIMDQRGPVAVEIPVEVAMRRKVEKATRPVKVEGWFGGLKFGTLLLGDDAPRLRLSGELGRRFRLSGALDLDLLATGGGFARTTDNENRGVFPLMLKMAFGLRTGGVRLYATAGGGVRFLRPDDGVGGMLSVGVGAAFRMGHSEVTLEAGYDLAGRVEQMEPMEQMNGDTEPARPPELAGWTVSIGYRFGSWFYP